jgi:hypothetical protein
MTGLKLHPFTQTLLIMKRFYLPLFSLAICALIPVLFLHAQQQPIPDDQPLSKEVPSTVQKISLPEITFDKTKNEMTAPVTTTQIDAKTNLVGFQGDFTFDERVVSFQNPPVQRAGLTGGNWNVSGNVLPGDGPIRTVRISAFSSDFAPLNGSGTLFELRMARPTKAGAASPSTPLKWEAAPNHFYFIGADLNTQKPFNATNGNVAVGAAAPAQPVKAAVKSGKK